MHWLGCSYRMTRRNRCQGLEMLGSRQEVAPSTAVLVERGGSFFVYEPNLGIITSDETVEGAYRRFASAKRALAEDAERAGLTLRRSVAPPRLPAQTRRSASGRRGVVAELTMFVAKIGIFFVVVGAIGAAVAMAVGGTSPNVKPLGMADIADKAGEIARDISSLSPEKKELLRQSVGTVSHELDPVVDAWRNPPSR
jgi:hypothetical protein